MSKNPAKEYCIDIIDSSMAEYEKTMFEDEYWPNEKIYIEADSYRKTILEYVKEKILESSIPPLVILENLLHLLDCWACQNPNTSFVFSSGYDVIEYIITQLV